MPAATAKKKRVPTVEQRQFPTDGMASVRDACEFLKLGRTKVYELMNEGRLQYVEFGRRRRIAWTVLRELAKSPTASA